MSDSTPATGSGGVQLTPRAITALVVAAAALIFVFSNTEDITLNFLWFELRAPGWITLLALFGAGLAVGFFMGRNRYKRR